MGNAESGPLVRNADKRSSRREHRAIFEAAAQRFRAAPFAAPDGGRLGEADSGRGVRVCVRKRPIFSHEIEQGEFDAITCLDGRLVVHDARMHPDMVKLFMNHHDFAFDDTFGESANNAEVYEGTARQLVLDALEGKQGTVMMYGQTGSGKTYTMRSIYEQAADDIFSGIGGQTVTVSFIELFGENCFDMLNQGAPCQLTTAQDGSVHPFPCVEVEVSNPMELLALIELAGKLRATAATGVHDQSSRSHALCRIFVESGDVEGCITLVDLAGSEHRIDNAEHNAERRKEDAKINASLAALKECIRARASHSKFIAFRQNRLTQLLRGCFLPGGHHETVVVATVSPSSKDTEHSLNTLRHACIMDGQGQGKQEKGSHLGGGHVTKETLGEIDALDVLLRNVDSLELKKLAQSVVDCGNALKPTAEPLATLGNQESVQLLQSLEVLQGHAQSLQELTKVACAAFHPMVRLGFFVPLALCATALLGRVYALSGEICEAVSAAAVVLTPTAAAIEPEAGTEVVLVPKAVGTARPSDDEDMGVPLAEEVGVAVERPVMQDVVTTEGLTSTPRRRRRLTSFPRAWSRPKGKQVQRLAGRPWRRLLRIVRASVQGVSLPY